MSTEVPCVKYEITSSQEKMVTNQVLSEVTVFPVEISLLSHSL